MKKKLLVLWITLGVVAGLLGALALMVGAASTAPNIEIAYCNLSFRDSICIKYAIPSSDADVKVLIWTSPRSEYLIGTQDDEITAYNTQNISGVSHKVFDYKLAAKQMADVVYARAYAQVDGEEYYSSVNKYSVLQYAYNKLGKTATASTDAELKDLLTQMLEYGAAAQKYLDDYKVDRLATADWYQIKVTAGVLDDGCTHGLYLPGDQVTITAPETNAEGVPFAYWESTTGNRYTDRAYTLTVGTKNETFTPVYGVPEVTGPVPDYDLSQDGTYYIVTGKGTYTNSDTELVIPAVYEGLPVKEIADEAFVDCEGFKTVTIFADLIRIGDYAFENCSGIENITLPASLTEIGSGVFYGCNNVKSITVPFVGQKADGTGDTKFSYLFGGSVPSNLQTVVITGGTSIGYEAFENCYDLTSITIPDSVTSIGDYAFYNCTGLTSIVIPESVTSIGNYAFYECDGLTRVVIPDGVTSIGDDVFYGCSRLTSIEIPEGVTSIGKKAFYGCSGLTSIEIPDSVTSIGEYAFYNCTSLTSIVIPDSVTNIGYEAFYNTAYYNNTSNWKRGALYIGNHLIATNSALSSSYTIRNGTKTIAPRAFYGRSNLTSVIIPDSVTNIGGYAFYDCSNLTSIEIPNSVTSIGAYAFYKCSSLTSIVIPDSVTSIGSEAFVGCSGLASVTIGNGVTSIGYYAFYNCYKLFEVINKSALPITAGSSDYGYVAYYAIEVHAGESKLVSLDDFLFYSCEKSNYLVGYTGTATELVLPDDYNGENYEIYSYAFSGSTSITSVTVPASVTRIGLGAFSGCSSITSMTLPFVGSMAGNDGEYDAVFGYIFGMDSYDGSESTMQFYGAGDVTYYIPVRLKSVTITGSIIPRSAFHNCQNLTDITIGGGVTSIGVYAFSGCSSLTSIVIPDSVTSIGSSAFYGCSKLTSITVPFVGATRNGTSNTHFGYIFGASSYSSNSSYVPASLKSVTITGKGTSIDDYAFWNCSNIASITIGKGVTSIGSYAFYDCTSLTTITFEGTVAEWNAISKGYLWEIRVPATTCRCSNGSTTLS